MSHTETITGVTVVKMWGEERVLVNGEKLCCKRLIVKPGYQCSYHRHLVKEETFIVEFGYGWLLLEHEPIALEPGVIVEIPVRAWHRFWNDSIDDLVMLEISTHHDDEDVQRLSQSGLLTTPPCVSPYYLRYDAPEEARNE